jgi:Domain of unknown function (DUF4258)
MLRHSGHAQKRMTERNVTSEQVQQVHDEPEITYPDVKGNTCYVRNLEGRRIRIVVAADDPTFVITVIASTIEE